MGIKAVVSIPLEDQLAVRSHNRTARHRTLPVGENAEYYMRSDGKIVLRPKRSNFKELPPQTRKLASCARQIKGDRFSNVEEVYQKLKSCMG